MDAPEPASRDGAPPDTWSTAPGLVAAAAAGALLLLLLLPGSDPPGRLLEVVGVLLLGGEALRGTLLRPTLRADADGLTLRTGLRTRTLPWSAVTSVNAESTRRRGARASSLVVDLDDDLVLLPRHRLGAEPATVAARLGELRGVSR